MLKMFRGVVAWAAALMFSVTLVAVGTPATASSDTASVRKRDSFWCMGSYNVVSRRTFGGAGWVQEDGVRSDGGRATRVYHPSGRWDEYRFIAREPNGTVWTMPSRLTNDQCVAYAPGQAVRPQARNGGQWWTGYWS